MATTLKQHPAIQVQAHYKVEEQLVEVENSTVFEDNTINLGITAILTTMNFFQIKTMPYLNFHSLFSFV